MQTRMIVNESRTLKTPEQNLTKLCFSERNRSSSFGAGFRAAFNCQTAREAESPGDALSNGRGIAVIERRLQGRGTDTDSQRQVEGGKSTLRPSEGGHGQAEKGWLFLTYETFCFSPILRCSVITSGNKN